MNKLNIGKCLIPALLALNVLSTSCDDNLDLTADYKDISISYALLNPNDPVHYFKIYRGYLTDDNAYVEAGNWESIYYPIDSIEVRLEEYNDEGTMLRSAVLDTTTAVYKDNGYFANPKQLLYYSTWTLNKENKYRLVIKHVNSGEEVYAQTDIVGNCRISKPVNQNPFNSKDNTGPKFVITGNGGGTARSNNAAVADFYITFNYIEVDKNTHEVTHKSISKKMNSSYKVPQSDGDINFDSFTPANLFLLIKQYVEPNDNVVRYIDTIDAKPYFCLKIDTWMANKEFSIYHSVSTPNSSIIQDRMDYTNFVSNNNNAYGLLASRNHCYRLFKFDNTNGNNNEDSLVKGSYTKGLNFDYYRNSPEFYEVVEK